jgi:hypothetical protein
MVRRRPLTDKVVRGLSSAIIGSEEGFIDRVVDSDDADERKRAQKELDDFYAAKKWLYSEIVRRQAWPPPPAHPRRRRKGQDDGDS